jgi:shikimate dehydrogenase
MILTGKARVAGVIGWPISHSRSPRLHGYWLEKHGIDGAYIPMAVPPDRIEQALRALPPSRCATRWIPQPAASARSTPLW